MVPPCAIQENGAPTSQQELGGGSGNSKETVKGLSFKFGHLPGRDCMSSGRCPVLGTTGIAGQPNTARMKTGKGREEKFSISFLLLV